jgi:uncharacterized damage-inducible protein DinB
MNGQSPPPPLSSLYSWLMQPDLREPFLRFSTSKLLQFEARIEDCLDRLTPEQIWARGSEAENAVGNLVLHLAGNLGQWIGTGVNRQPLNRDRDAEFAARGAVDSVELKRRIRTAVTEAVDVIGGLSAERLSEVIQIQKYDITVLEAVYHVVEHFAQHTAQIIFATKLMTKKDLGYYAHLSQPKHKETTP